MTPATAPRLHVGVLGAGSIGCYVGGRLASTCTVTLIGRPAVLDAIAERGLTVGRSGRATAKVPASELTLAVDVEAAKDCDVVLFTVKSHDTEQAARALAGELDPESVVISLQNGLHNAPRLRDILESPVLAGMVPFNVIQPEPGTFMQATSGELMIEAGPAVTPFARAARTAGLPLEVRKDIVAVQHAKLLMNLNNAVNALSGLPLKDQLADRDYRLVLALCQEEALAVFSAAGVAPARLSPLPPSAMVRLLRAGDSIFTTVARTALKVHPDARSSMSDDLALGRRTEIDELQGAIVELGIRHHVPTPVNARVAALVRAAERDGPQDRTTWTSEELLGAVTT